MKYIFILLLIVACFSSCTIQRKLYSPTQVNSPSLESKNDFSTSVSYSSPSGFDANGGFAITNRLAIIGGFYSYKNKDQEEQSGLFIDNANSALSYKHNGFHVGTGFYFPISKNKSPNFLSFFGGYTKGKFEMQESFTEPTIPTTPPTPITPKLNFYKSDINRWFIQGSINHYSQMFHQSFITRFNYVGYNNINTDYTLNEQQSFNFPDKGYPKWSSFIDFSFDSKIFFSKEQRLGLQFFGTISLRTNREDFNFYYYPFRGGTGLIFKSPFQNKEPKK